MLVETFVVRLVLISFDVWFYLRHPKHTVWFRRRVGRWPRISMPRYYQEKMLWRRVVDRNPLFSILSDKLAVKDWAAKIAPSTPAPKTLWVGRNVDDLQEFERTSTVFLKSNHACGHNLKLEPTDSIDDEVKKTVASWLDEVWGIYTFEWAYWQIKPFLFLEESVAQNGEAVVDVSVHAMRGKPAVIEAVAGIKSKSQQKAYFHPDGRRWREIEPPHRAPGDQLLATDWPLPNGWKAAVQSAALLSREIDYARFDFLVSNGQTYQGEITLYPGAGLNDAVLFAAYSAEIHAAWDITHSWFLNAPQRGFWKCYRWAMLRFLSWESHKICLKRA